MEVAIVGSDELSKVNEECEWGGHLANGGNWRVVTFVIVCKARQKINDFRILDFIDSVSHRMLAEPPSFFEIS